VKIVFFGSPATAVTSLKRLLEKGHDIGLVVTQPDRPAGRGKKISPSPVKQLARELNIPVFQPPKIRKDPQALKRIQDAGPDLNVVVAYGQIIPAPLIYFPEYNSINLHFSLLPRYRGASPVAWAILNGEHISGVTIFELNEKMDEGDILARKEVEILPNENARELENRLAKIGADLLCETIDRIGTIPHIKQDHSLATYAPLLKKEDGRIDWARDAASIDRKVRAFTPWPSAFAYYGDKRLKILKGRPQQGRLSPSFPGKILKANKEGLAVGCGEKSVYLIEELQQEGRRVMNAYVFSIGARIGPGDKLH
jgi:methionyl-tRNA formyltransferase